MGKERREFERIDSLISIKYAAKKQEISGNSLTKDVSAGGVGLPVNGKITTGEDLDLMITLPQDPQKPITVTARVAWSKRNFEHWKSRYSSGLRFINISEADKDKLLNYVQGHRWVKSDFERALEEHKVPILDTREPE